MNFTFAYPTLANPTAIVTLPDSEQLPRSRPTRMHQVAFDSDAGEQTIYDHGGTSEVFTLRLTTLSQSQSAAIESFFISDVSGRARAFQFQDSDGSILDVRFAQDVIEPMQIGVSWVNVILTMRVL